MTGLDAAADAATAPRAARGGHRGDPAHPLLEARTRLRMCGGIVCSSFVCAVFDCFIVRQPVAVLLRRAGEGKVSILIEE